MRRNTKPELHRLCCMIGHIINFSFIFQLMNEVHHLKDHLKDNSIIRLRWDSPSNKVGLLNGLRIIQFLRFAYVEEWNGTFALWEDH
jgi:hypothetical protein